jgi:hypothetical protein
MIQNMELVLIGAEPRAKFKLDVMKKSGSDRAFGSASTGPPLAASMINVLCDTPPLAFTHPFC